MEGRVGEWMQKLLNGLLTGQLLQVALYSWDLNSGPLNNGIVLIPFFRSCMFLFTIRISHVHENDTQF